MSNAPEVFDGAWYPNSRTSARSGYGDTGTPFSLVHEHPLGSEQYPIIIASDEEDLAAQPVEANLYTTRVVELPQLYLFRQRLRTIAARAQYQRTQRPGGARQNGRARNGRPVVLEFCEFEREIEELIAFSFEVQISH